ncbi:EcsC family protein [Peribacillus frigoritolerans]|uniref:EcsC family protein n=1 Tax=Peribacillus frigoritolerans TaxID=450367 RepID=UPI00215AF846|nr:EcsC family protein [Peribacillus frigoritolerans]MCR8867823.1 EcsC family protein [Peribacillus frigoritolerans]
MKLETKEELEKELTIIEKWEKDQKGLWFWERIGRIPFKLLDKLTPDFIQKKLGVMLDEIGSYIQNGGKYLTKEAHILSQLQANVPELNINDLEDVSSIPLHIMDSVSQDIKTSSSKLATVQGATTGIGGIFTLAIDIPLLLGMSIKTLQDIAITYGFKPRDRQERIFIVKCLQFTTSDVVGKKALLNELSKMNQTDSQSKREIASELQGWREVVYTYRDQFGWKKLLQMVPVAGIIFGAITNRSMIADIADTGIMLYKKRRILERIQEPIAKN